jgi:hypothetical protein
MQSKAKTVEAYLAELPAERREALEALRAVFRKNLPQGYEEGMQYGMIGYYVPHSVYPPGYHCDPKQPVPFAGLASQKNHMSMYLMCIYSDAGHQAWFQKAWQATGKKLDMGKACIRFKKLEDVPLEVVGQAVKRVPVSEFLAHYESVIKTMGKRPKSSSAKKTPAKKAVKKKATARQTAARKTAVKKAAVKKTTRKAARKVAAKGTIRTAAKR